MNQMPGDFGAYPNAYGAPVRAVEPPNAYRAPDPPAVEFNVAWVLGGGLAALAGVLGFSAWVNAKEHAEMREDADLLGQRLAHDEGLQAALHATIEARLAQAEQAIVASAARPALPSMLPSLPSLAAPVATLYGAPASGMPSYVPSQASYGPALPSYAPSAAPQPSFVFLPSMQPSASQAAASMASLLASQGVAFAPSLPAEVPVYASAVMPSPSYVSPQPVSQRPTLQGLIPSYRPASMPASQRMTLPFGSPPSAPSARSASASRSRLEREIEKTLRSQSKSPRSLGRIPTLVGV
jgi:hypothetical protein